MNLKILFFFLIFILNLDIYSQKQLGIIITNKKDTINGYISVYEKNVIPAYKEKIKYWIGDKKHSLSVNQIDKIIFDDCDFYVIKTKYEDFSDVLDSKIIHEKKIAKLVIDGKNKLYEYYFIRSSYDNTTGGSIGSYVTSHNAIITLNGGFSLSNYGFKPIVKKAFSYCPEVLKNLKSKKYKNKSILNVIKDSNELCD